MAAVEVTISGLLYDKLNRTTQNVVLIGEASLTGVGIGGGPIIPPVQPPGGGGDNKPPGIWGGPIDPYPGHPLPEPPTRPELPPDLTPPNPPQPGDPTTAVPGNWPTQPITPPPFIIVNYPGIGPIVVPPPATAG